MRQASCDNLEKPRLSWRGLLSFALLAMLPPACPAQSYPSKPLRMVVPYPPGGAADLLGRLVGQKLSERVGQPVVVETRAGGGGNIGAEYVVKSPADGYTIMIGGLSLAINQSLFKNVSYNLANDLTAIAQIATYQSMIVVHPSLPAKSMKELIALARAKPGAINFGAGPGSPNHLGMELINVMAGVKMVHVGYKGSGPVLTDLIGGHLHCASVGFPGVTPHVLSGRLRALAVTGKQRSALLPDLPTVAEAALPGYNVSSWWGVFGPARMPSDIVTRLSAEIRGLMETEDTKTRLAAVGTEVETGTFEEFTRLVRAEIPLWAKVVKASGATAN